MKLSTLFFSIATSAAPLLTTGVALAHGNSHVNPFDVSFEVPPADASAEHRGVHLENAALWERYLNDYRRRKDAREELKDRADAWDREHLTGEALRSSIARRRAAFQDWAKNEHNLALTYQAMLRDRHRDYHESRSGNREAELARLERERLERERIERERLHQERLAQLERERIERDRLARLDRERIERDRRVQLERERVARVERERLERLERERLAQQVRRNRLKTARPAQGRLELRLTAGGPLIR